MARASAADLARQSENWGQEVAPGELVRLDRRQFLRGGALTVAGLATVSGVQILEAPAALAQGGGSLVSNVQLLGASSAAIPGQPSLRICRHSYRFDYNLGTGGTTLPPDLVRTFRLNIAPLGGQLQPGFQLADQPQVLLQPAPFQNPAAPPADPFPQPAGGAPAAGVAPSPQLIQGLACYRLVQITDLQTFPVQRIARVFDWCSLYCFPGNVIVIVIGDQSLSYVVGSGGATPPPGQQKNVVNDAPQLVDFWQAIQSGVPHSIGGVYYYTFSSQQTAVSTATWTANLDVPLGTNCRVDVHIPGSSAPQNRTARATYEVSNIGVVGINRVTISQQLATSQWVTLGTFPFRPGSFSVRLTDLTGEPTGSRVVVADAVRWVSP